MDKFFTKKNCDRCGKDLQDGRIMSMFNEDCICMKCKDEETKHKDYNKARDREEDSVSIPFSPEQNALFLIPFRTEEKKRLFQVDGKQRSFRHFHGCRHLRVGVA